jgi:hypothetical protein
MQTAPFGSSIYSIKISSPTVRNMFPLVLPHPTAEKLNEGLCRFAYQISRFHFQRVYSIRRAHLADALLGSMVAAINLRADDAVRRIKPRP